MTESTDNPANVSTRTKRKRNGIYIIVILFIGLMFFTRHEPVNTIDCTPEIIASKPDVIMLGAWWCTYCYQAKKYFQQNSIQYCEYDVENTATGKRLYQEHGGGAVPILLIGEYQLNGFSQRQVQSALATLNNQPDEKL